jgi:hypothetical protein
MEQVLTSLNDCIDRQLILYRKLLDLFHLERRAILESDLDALNQAVMDKEIVLQRIRREELQRKQVADKIATLLELPPESLTITRLSKRVPEPHASDMKRRGGELQALIETIQVESERNRSLCLQALHFVNGSLKMLTTLTRPNQVYHATGRVQNEGRIGRMLSGAV